MALEPSAGLQKRIRERLLASLQPVKPLAPMSVYFAGFLAAFVLLACAVTAAMGTAGLRLMSAAQLSSIIVVLAAGAVLLAFLLAKQTAPATIQWIPTPLAVLLFGAAVLTVTTLLFPWRAPGASITLSWQCLLRVLAIAAPAAAPAWLSLRRAAALSATAKGAAIGATAGLLGVAVLQFACMYQEGLHLLLWHWSGMVIASLLGALIGRLGGRFSFHRP